MKLGCSEKEKHIYIHTHTHHVRYFFAFCFLTLSTCFFFLSSLSYAFSCSFAHLSSLAPSFSLLFLLRFSPPSISNDSIFFWSINGIFVGVTTTTLYNLFAEFLQTDVWKRITLALFNLFLSLEYFRVPSPLVKAAIRASRNKPSTGILLHAFLIYLGRTYITSYG